MQDSAFEKMLQQIAWDKQVSSRELRLQMQQAMEEAFRNPDPAVRAMWDSVPRQGTAPTLEEFMDYLIEKNLVMF